jgi:hypothetical protein
MSKSLLIEDLAINPGEFSWGLPVLRSESILLFTTFLTLLTILRGSGK